MIVGVGVDLVDVARFERSLDRTPALRDRLFAPDEAQRLSVESLAGRFAAKEALVKALAEPLPGWHEAVIASDPSGRPLFRFGPAMTARLAERAIVAVHLSISHDAGMAAAFVVAES